MTNNNKSFWKRTPVKIAVLIFIIIAVALSLNKEDEKMEVITEMSDSSRIVSLYDISNDNGSAVKTADGSAFIVRSQSGGRVDKVAKIGDVVKAGATIAELENSAQRAAYIQAEGAYEAARAGSLQSNISVSQAENNVTSAIDTANTANRNAYNTVNNIILNTIDVFYSNPVSGYIGVRVSGDTTLLNSERIAFRDILLDWQNSSKFDLNENNVLDQIEYAITQTTRLISLVEVFGRITSDTDHNDTLNDLPLSSYNSNILNALSTLSGTLSNLNGAKIMYQNALDTREQAKIGGTNSTNSLSNAQIKQALGVLESARASLNKTIIKTPVSGTVTAVSISVGDIINVGNDVVFVTGDDNATTLENSATVPLTAVKFTPTKAYIFSVAEGELIAHEIKTGLVTSNSITISEFGDVTQIVTDVRGLKAGDAVLIQ